MAPANKAAWLTAAKAHPFEVLDAPLPSPGPKDIIIKAEAWAINPLEWKIQKFAFMPLDYPIIMGNDVAGTVFEVGSEVTKFKRGDKVTGVGAGMVNRQKDNAAFQLYPRIEACATLKLPAGMDSATGSVIPTCLYTAANGLFAHDYLGLPLPQLNAPRTGKTVLVWGGASAVGLNAIQLAHLAGVTVVTTASTRNFDLVKSHGADHVVDYKSATAIKDLVALLKGADVVGAHSTIGGEADKSCAEVLKQAGGGSMIATTLPPSPESPPAAKFVEVPDFLHTDMGIAVTEFVEQALAKGIYKASPEALVVGKGLEAIQGAVDAKFTSTSVNKIVVTA